jgi:nitrogen fixation protein FixH
LSQAGAMSAAVTRKDRGSWIPWLLLLFMLIVLAANGALIWLATTSWTGLAVDQAYEKGLAYNRNLEAARQQTALGWQPRLDARVVTGLSAEAELTITNRQGAPVTGAKVEAAFARPTQHGFDFRLTLAQGRPGVYRAMFELPLPGLWDVHVTIRRGGSLFVHNQRLVLR